MNLKHLFISLGCILSTMVCAQNSNIGYVTYESYNVRLSKTRGPTERELYFNKEESLEIVRTEKVGYDKNSIDLVKQGLFNRGDTDSIGIRIYRNTKSQQLITRRPDNPISDAFVVQEAWLTIDWKIFPENTKIIEGLPCTKAVGDFRGRTYIAWFTPEIPYPFGPWKLHGLPGLILEARDLEGNLRFELFDHDFPTSVDDKIIEIPTQGEVITHEREVYLLDQFDEILIKKLNNRIKPGAKSTFKAKATSKGRNPDAWELVYDWERQ